jgi:hypothetical protein
MSDPIDNTQYKRNALGHFVPVEQIQEVDIIRDDLVNRIVQAARHLQAAMTDFKKRTLTEIDSFIDLSASEYDTQFGERLQVAKTLIDELIHEWTKDSDGKIKALIEHAFQTDKEGNINKGRVLSLFRLKIDDPKWLKAMDAIRDSMQASHSKEYLSLYERVGNDDKYVRISLDMAVL